MRQRIALAMVGVAFKICPSIKEPIRRVIQSQNDSDAEYAAKGKCLFGIFHDFVPTRYLTCNPHDEGFVCRKCYAEV